MIETLYRFRSINNALSTGELNKKDSNGNAIPGRDELRKHQIYFSAFDKLNDPMEGNKDLYWRGDEIVWNNLLLWCL
jgi:hypothetical protein